MSLTLYYHPLASFCHKVLVALYENETPFRAQFVDLGDEASSAELRALWPVGKIPVLRDEARGRAYPETSVILEYLDTHYPGRVRLLPADPELALEVRLWDRFFDLYLAAPVGKIVTDRLRPPGQADPLGVEEARAMLRRAYGHAEQRMQGRTWAVGEALSLADCAAAPALFYAAIAEPFAAGHPNLAAYFERLVARPSFARVLDEARPHLARFPLRDAVPPRFLAGSPTRAS